MVLRLIQKEFYMSIIKCVFDASMNDVINENGKTFYSIYTTCEK